MIRWGYYDQKYLVGRKCSGYPDGAEVESTVKGGERARDGLVGCKCGRWGGRLLGDSKHLRAERLRQGREKQFYGWQVKEFMP